MFGGKTKRDLDEVIINLSRAYDFIEAYAESQKEAKDSIGYREARSVMDYIFCCFKGLQSIGGDPFISAFAYLYLHRYSDERLPNVYTAVFANPNATTSPETENMLNKIKILSDAARLHSRYEDYEEAKKLIDQYCKKVQVRTQESEIAEAESRRKFIEGKDAWLKERKDKG